MTNIIGLILNVATMVSVITVGLFLKSYLPTYFAEKAKNLATKEDFDNLLDQVKRTTAATEAIKSQVSQAEAVGQSDLEFAKQQLAELYGPIYSYCKLNEQLYRIFMTGVLQDINAEIIGTFKKQNESIIEILASKLHLVVEGTLPSEFTHFMTSVTLWNIYTARKDQPWLSPEVEKLPESKYPIEFIQYIYSTTESLKARVDQLHKKYKIT